MKFYEGVTDNSGTIKINKAISSLLFMFTRAQLNLMEISIEIERANGKNEEITKGGFQKFSNLVRLTKEEGEVIGFSQQETKAFALIELTEDGGSIFLEEQENIKVQLKGLGTANTKMFGIEEATFSEALRTFEEKSVGSEDKEKSITVTGYDIALIDNTDESLEELILTYQNGKTVKYEELELRGLNQITNPFLSVDGSSHNLEDEFKVLVPLVFVDTMTIRKSQGSIMNITLRKG